MKTNNPYVCSNTVKNDEYSKSKLALLQSHLLHSATFKSEKKYIHDLVHLNIGENAPVAILMTRIMLGDILLSEYDEMMGFVEGTSEEIELLFREASELEKAMIKRMFFITIYYYNDGLIDELKSALKQFDREYFITHFFIIPTEVA